MRPRLFLLIFLIPLILTLPLRAQQKPFTRDQVEGLVRDGLGDDSGAKLIEQRGIDFAPADDFLQTLKAAGASEAFLNALRSAKHPEPTSAKKPLNQVQVITLLAAQVPSHRVAMLVEERGIDFDVKDDYLQEVRLSGGGDELIAALKNARVTKPESIDQALRARQAEIRQHVAHGTELAKKGQYAEAELEYRAALLVDSQNDDIYVSLAYVLLEQKKWDDTASAAREALRLNPNNDLAHVNLGVALGNEGDWDGEIAEERTALRLNPNNSLAHANLGAALGNKGDQDGMITEEREALRLNPNNDMAHVGLGTALGNKGDRDGMITEEREAVRLNPNNDMAHVGLGLALGSKGDNEGMIAEEREAVRLSPNNGLAHAALGLALEKTGDRLGALEEYRAACTLDPKNATYRQNYARLSQQLSK